MSINTKINIATKNENGIILCLVFHNSVEYMNWASQFLSDADPIIVMGGMCISGSSHIDHRSETVENESKIHMIPSTAGLAELVHGSPVLPRQQLSKGRSFLTRALGI